MNTTYNYETTKTDEGYRFNFNTSKGNLYKVELFRFYSDQAIFKQAFVLEFSKDKKVSLREQDENIHNTINRIVYKFLKETKPTALLIFNYEINERSDLARRRLFSRWLNILNVNNEFLIQQVDTSSSESGNLFTLVSRRI